MYGVSMLAVLSAIPDGYVLAQEAADDEEQGEEFEEIVVTGVKSSLMSAQAIKRNAGTVVDSITASDLGAFPDKSIAEALQRVAGITVERFASSDDTAHFSAEPSGVVIRGLQQVRSEFNGRDSFSANSSRGLSWSDISPELMAGVDTYKNQMAELIEGGIAGTVNLRTRTPFDSDGEAIAASVNMNYGDLSKKAKPEVSALYSNRWETAGGEFGIMLNAAYSDIQTASQGVVAYRADRFGGLYDADGDGVPEGTQVDGVWDQDSILYIPEYLGLRDNIYTRERTGISAAAQWRSNDGTMEALFQYNRSVYENGFEEYVLKSYVSDSFGQPLDYVIDNFGLAPQAADGTNPFTFDSNGFFQTGVLTADMGWWGASSDESALVFSNGPNGTGDALINPCYGWNGCTPARRSPSMGTGTRTNQNRNMTQDFGFNFKWTPTDRLSFNFDAHYVDATVRNFDIEVEMQSYATPIWDLTGAYPTLAFTDPININYADGGLSNPDNYRYHFIMDHTEDSSGDEVALKVDGEYDIDNGWLESVKFGARYADRDQAVNYSTYNWQNVANAWTQNAHYGTVTSTGASGDFNGFPDGVVNVREYGLSAFQNSLQGSSIMFPFFDMDRLQDQQWMMNNMSATALGLTGGAGWDPVCSNVGDRANEVAGSCYTLGEMVDVSEETKAAYVQVNFGGDDATFMGKPVSGNFGVRFVETTVVSSGAINHPSVNLPAEELVCADRDLPPGVPEGSALTRTFGCFISDDDLAFMDGLSTAASTTTTHHNWLPSFNMKMELTDKWQFRIAASRAMSRPDIGNLRNFIEVGRTLPDLNNANDPQWIKDSDGNVTGADIIYRASAQNPSLKPVTADQVDVSLEYYFDAVGSFTVAAFYKKFHDYIQFGSYGRDITVNGVTKTVEVRGPLNGDGASIKGFEVSYQNFFEGLPAPFDGIGIQANYTYVDNNGVTNSGIGSQESDASTVTSQSPTVIEVDRLEGLSDHAINIVGMYEKGPLALRVAYNWRSEYLITAVDCCVAYAVWNDAPASVDASIRYRLNDFIELSLQGQNLTSGTTVLTQQVRDASEGGLRLPNAWHKNDRRFTFGVRAKF